MSEIPVVSAHGRLLLSPVQAVAIAHRSWYGSGEQLAELVSLHLPRESVQDILKSLHCSHLQRELFLKRDVGLWKAQPAGGFILIDYSPPDSIAHAIWFANRERPRGKTCRFCDLPDHESELLQEDYGTHRAYIHPRCRRAALVWSSWARQSSKPKPVAAPMWWEVLGLASPRATDAEIESGFKRAAMAAHPDRGGSDEAMKAVTAARDEALGARTGRSKRKAG